jgi:hypothetical protein
MRADKDGGAHVDEKVPLGHAALSEPAVFYGSANGDRSDFVRPNIAYGITAEAGCEMLDFLERHFIKV